NVKGHLEDHMHHIDEAAQLLRKGEVVAFPTETVYGLGADATNEGAVAKIFKAKNRPQDNPLLVHVATTKQLKTLVRTYPIYVDRLLEESTTGPSPLVSPRMDAC